MLRGKSILVIDDEEHILELIRYNLEKEGYRVLACETGERGLEVIWREIPHLLILDLMLPGMNGLEVCKKLREDDRTMRVPVIMLTAKSQVTDRVAGLETGADDYLTKPFSVRELVARVKAVLRRTSGNEDRPGVLEVGQLTIDTSAFRVYKNGNEVELTNKEYELLKVLAANKGRTLTRDYLLDKVWGYEFFGETRTVDVHVRHLRKKLEPDDAYPGYIETVRGIGYRMANKGDDHA